VRGAGDLLRQRRPEIGRLWVRYAPRRWPAPGGPWLDLFAGGLGAGDGDAHDIAALAALPVDDLLYLPPVRPELRAERDALAAAQAARGTPVLSQLLPGEPAPAAPATAVLDLLPLAVAGRPPAVAALGAQGAVWPLLPVLGGGPQLWEEVAAAAAGAGLGWLQAVAVEADPRQMRELAEALDEERALALFHASPPPPAGVAAAAVGAGLAPFAPRALPRPPLRGADDLRLAALLAETGELCRLLGEPASRREGFLRAARWAEDSRPSLAALCREGNLTVLDWLEEEPRRLVAEAVAGGLPSALDELRRQLAATRPACEGTIRT
jgi:hypothetical protein